MKTYKHLARDNRGFSLVELIVVMTIVALLTAVAAPQYIKHVEKSRVGVDESYIAMVARSLEVLIATDVRPEETPVTVTFNTAGKIQGCVATGVNPSAVKARVDALLLDIHPGENQRFLSRYYTGTGADSSPGVTLVLGANGLVTISGTKNLNT